MDLMVKDVAELLSISEDEVNNLIVAGGIPFYRLNREVRFSRIEIEDWMLNRNKSKGINVINLKTEKAKNIIANQIGTHAYGLFRALYKGKIINNVEGRNKREVIKEAVQQIAKDLKADPDVLLELLMDRENLMPTSINHGVAVPHTRDFILNTQFDTIWTVYPKHPIEYGALDGKPVHTLFFLFAGEDKRHLRLLAKLAHLTREQGVLEFLQSRPEKAPLLQYVKKWEGSLNITAFESVKI